MRNLLVLIILIIPNLVAYSQVQPYKIQTGPNAEDNLNRVINVAPLSTGGMGFDTRYEGVKGSPLLFEKLLPAFVKMKSQVEYFKLNVDLDVYQNRLIFTHPKTGKLLALPSSYINEVVINTDSIKSLFKTTASMNFGKELKDVKFCEILKDNPWQLIKLPVKILNEADYKKVYGIDKRYDEFETSYKYFILTGDSLFHQVQPNKKSMIKLFPEKRNLIEETISANPDLKGEEMILVILNKF